MPELKHVFRADAVAIGGYLVRPVQQPIPSVTAKVPLLGGSVSQRQENTVLPFIAVEAAYATASGVVDGEGTARSYAQAIVEGLTVGHIVTVDRCIATVVSEQPLGQQPSVQIADVRLEGLRVYGRDVLAQLSVPFNAFPTFDDWRRFASDSGHGEDWAVRGDKPAQKASENGDLIWAHMGVSLSMPAGSNSDARIERNVIHLEDFGSIHFGEILIARSYRRISMLRFQLGSPVEGQVEICSSKGGSVGL